MTGAQDLLQCLALAGSPYQWAILVVVVVIIVAPRMLPLLGRLASLEARRRIGLPAPKPSKRVLPPDSVIEPAVPGAIESAQREPAHARPGASVWIVFALAGLAVAVLSWWLLRDS